MVWFVPPVNRIFRAVITPVPPVMVRLQRAVTLAACLHLAHHERDQAGWVTVTAGGPIGVLYDTIIILQRCGSSRVASIPNPERRRTESGCSPRCYNGSGTAAVFFLDPEPWRKCDKGVCQAVRSGRIRVVPACADGSLFL